MKEKIQSLLARYPALYKKILFLKGNGNLNLDKISFLSLIQDKDIVLDVGANVGYHTLLFSQIVGEKGYVHAFEPVSDTFNRLSRFIEKNASYGNIQLNNTALGESSMGKEIFVPDNDFGQASFAKREADYVTNASYQILQTTMDAYVGENGLERLDFVKIDIEGYELKCLEGAQQTLARFAPTLYLEIYNEWSSKFGYSPPDIVSFLEKFGYSEFYLVHNGVKRLSNVGAQLQPRVFAQPANLICATPLRARRKARSIAQVRICSCLL